MESPKPSSQHSKRVKCEVADEITDGELDCLVLTGEYEQDVDDDLEYLDLADVEANEDEGKAFPDLWHHVPTPGFRSLPKMLSRCRSLKKRSRPTNDRKPRSRIG